MAKLVDALDLSSSGYCNREGSNPSSPTKFNN